jgi:Uma2 family endonuclease
MSYLAPEQPLSFDEYLAFERRSLTKHELVDGRAYAMAGASFAHNVLVANIIGSLRSALEAGGCYTLPSDMKVRTASKAYYPDASVVCGPPQFHDASEDVLLNPSILVEVLSDSTERIDRGEKLQAYTSMPSVTDYLLVASRRVRVEHFARTRNFQPLVLGAGDRITIANPPLNIGVQELYARVF